MRSWFTNAPEPAISSPRVKVVTSVAMALTSVMGALWVTLNTTESSTVATASGFDATFKARRGQVGNTPAGAETVTVMGAVRYKMVPRGFKRLVSSAKLASGAPTVPSLLSFPVVETYQLSWFARFGEAS